MKNELFNMKDIFKNFKEYGMEEEELKKLFIRLTQFIVLDKAIYEIELQNKELTAENLKNKLLEMKDDEDIPPLNSLQDYIVAYNHRNRINKRKRKTINTAIPEKCEFLFDCPSNNITHEEGSDKINYHKDHVIPRKWGGDDNNRNIQFLCKRHNLIKRDQIFWDEGVLPLRGWKFEF